MALSVASTCHRWWLGRVLAHTRDSQGHFGDQSPPSTGFQSKAKALQPHLFLLHKAFHSEANLQMKCGSALNTDLFCDGELFLRGHFSDSSDGIIIFLRQVNIYGIRNALKML